MNKRKINFKTKIKIKKIPSRYLYFKTFSILLLNSYFIIFLFNIINQWYNISAIFFKFFYSFSSIHQTIKNDKQKELFPFFNTKNFNFLFQTFIIIFFLLNILPYFLFLYIKYFINLLFKVFFIFKNKKKPINTLFFLKQEYFNIVLEIVKFLFILLLIQNFFQQLKNFKTPEMQKIFNKFEYFPFQNHFLIRNILITLEKKELIKLENLLSTLVWILLILYFLLLTENKIINCILLILLKSYSLLLNILIKYFLLIQKNLQNNKTIIKKFIIQNISFLKKIKEQPKNQIQKITQQFLLSLIMKILILIITFYYSNMLFNYFKHTQNIKILFNNLLKSFKQNFSKNKKKSKTITIQKNILKKSNSIITFIQKILNNIILKLTNKNEYRRMFLLVTPILILKFFQETVNNNILHDLDFINNNFHSLLKNFHYFLITLDVNNFISSNNTTISNDCLFHFSHIDIFNFLYYLISIFNDVNTINCYQTIEFPMISFFKNYQQKGSLDNIMFLSKNFKELLPYKKDITIKINTILKQLKENFKFKTFSFTLKQEKQYLNLYYFTIIKIFFSFFFILLEEIRNNLKKYHYNNFILISKFFYFIPSFKLSLNFINKLKYPLPILHLLIDSLQYSYFLLKLLHKKKIKKKSKLKIQYQNPLSKKYLQNQ